MPPNGLNGGRGKGNEKGAELIRYMKRKKGEDKDNGIVQNKAENSENGTELGQNSTEFGQNRWERVRKARRASWELGRNAPPPPLGARAKNHDPAELTARASKGKAATNTAIAARDKLQSDLHPAPPDKPETLQHILAHASDGGISVELDRKAKKARKMSDFTSDELALLTPEQKTKILRRENMDRINIADDINDALFAPRDEFGGKTGIQMYVSNYVNDAINDPGGRAAQNLANVLFSADMLHTTLDTFKTGAERDEGYEIYRLRSTLFDEQKVVYDNNTDKRIMIICSRRAGKTELNARLLLRACLTSDTPTLYLNKTVGNAIGQMWQVILDLLPSTPLTVAAGTSKSDGLLSLSNGSTIKFGGVNDIGSIDKLRGYKYKVVIVDEIGHIKNGHYLVDEVLTPTTIDYKGSQMYFTGTPPRSKNYASELWASHIKKYHWTMFDNPFIEGSEEFIRDLCKEKGLTADDPYIRREYYGDMEAYDTDALIFCGHKSYDGPFSPSVLPPTFAPTKVYIGVDFGYVDYNAIITVSVDDISHKAYVIEEKKFNRVGEEYIIAELLKSYNNALAHISSYSLPAEKSRVLVVTDTNKPELAHDLQNKYHLNVAKAYKYDEASSWADLATECRTARLLVPRGGICDDEMDRTMWKRDDDTDIITPEIDDELYHPDALDALRYASRVWLMEWQKHPSVSHGVPIDTTRPKGLETWEEIRDATLPDYLKKGKGGTETVETIVVGE